MQWSIGNELNLTNYFPPDMEARVELTLNRYTIAISARMLLEQIPIHFQSNSCSAFEAPMNAVSRVKAVIGNLTNHFPRDTRIHLPIIHCCSHTKRKKTRRKKTNNKKGRKKDTPPQETIVPYFIHHSSHHQEMKEETP